MEWLKCLNKGDLKCLGEKLLMQYLNEVNEYLSQEVEEGGL